MTSFFCLAMAIFFEGRDQSITGQQAIANVIMNRVESHRWPDTVCEVVTQRKQYSFTHDGLSDDYTSFTSNDIDRRSIAMAEEIAKEVLEGDLLGLTSTHYHTISISVAPAWASHYNLDGVIQDHVFYTAIKGL